MNTEKITVYANPKCKYCLGQGAKGTLRGSLSLFGMWENSLTNGAGVKV